MSDDPSIDRVARALHATVAMRVERDDMRTIPAYDDYADGWKEDARYLLERLSPTELLALAAKGMSEEEREELVDSFALEVLPQLRVLSPLAGFDTARTVARIGLAALLPEQDASSQGGPENE